MKIFVCTDKSKGMMFFGKRVSSDSVLTAKIMELVGDNTLSVSTYSSKLFTDFQNINVTDDLSNADYAFIENIDVTDNIDTIYLFNWNRDYPADKYFEIDLSNYTKESKEEFTGSSHDKITLEVYKVN